MCKQTLIQQLPHERCLEQVQSTRLPQGLGEGFPGEVVSESKEKGIPGIGASLGEGKET